MFKMNKTNKKKEEENKTCVYIYIYVSAWGVAREVAELRGLSGGTTCLTLLVQCRFSSKVTKHVANYDDA